MRKHLTLLFSLMVLGFPNPSEAIVQHVPKQALCYTTDIAIVGKVSSISSYYSTSMGMIVSDVTFNVERTVKGTHVSSRTVFVMGGTLSTGEHMSVGEMPEFVVDERYFLLLHARGSLNPTIKMAGAGAVLLDPNEGTSHGSGHSDGLS